MRVSKFIFCAFLTIGLISFCTTNAYAETMVNHTKNSDLINTVYAKFVFAIEAGENNNPEIYFTSNALKKLQKDYEYDCDDGRCYAYYALRTTNQDSNPNSDNVSQIYSVMPTDNGWYIVSYSDMGWNGKTRIRIVDGKIDDYERLEPIYNTYNK